MPLKDRWRSGGSCLWMLLLLPLLCCLVLAQGSTLSPEDSRSTTAAMLPEDWTNTTVPLQPDLQTVGQTPTEEPAEAPTEDQTEAPTEMQTQVFTNNYTGWVFH